VVGGYDSQQKHAGQDGVRFVTIPKARQHQAMTFLAENALETPDFLIEAEILRRIEVSGIVARIGSAQGRVLRSLLSSARIVRLVEQEALDGDAAYAAATFLNELRASVWSELEDAQVEVDPYRRELQRTYLSIMSEKLNSRRPVTSDERAFVRGELRVLDGALDDAMNRAGNRTSRFHLEDARDQIARMLDPTFTAGSTNGTASGIALTALTATSDAIADPSDPLTPFLCWPDYAVEVTSTY